MLSVSATIPLFFICPLNQYGCHAAQRVRYSTLHHELHQCEHYFVHWCFLMWFKNSRLFAECGDENRVLMFQHFCNKTIIWFWSVSLIRNASFTELYLCSESIFKQTKTIDIKTGCWLFFLTAGWRRRGETELLPRVTTTPSTWRPSSNFPHTPWPSYPPPLFLHPHSTPWQPQTTHQEWWEIATHRVWLSQLDWSCRAR